MEFTEKVNSADVVRPVATDGFYTIGYINNTPAQWAGYNLYDCKAYNFVLTSQPWIETSRNEDTGEIIETGRKFFVNNGTWKLSDSGIDQN